MRAHLLTNQMPVGVLYHYELVVGADETGNGGTVIDRWSDHNLVPLVGVNYLANAMFGDIAPIGTWYLGLFLNNYVPSAGATAADLPSVIGEFVGYSETTRPTWARVNTNGLWSNSASRAAFTCTQSARLYGGFLVSAATKGSGDGTLLSVARFSSPKDVEVGMTLRVQGDLSLIPTAVV